MHPSIITPGSAGIPCKYHSTSKQRIDRVNLNIAQKGLQVTFQGALVFGYSVGSILLMMGKKMGDSLISFLQKTIFI